MMVRYLTIRCGDWVRKVLSNTVSDIVSRNISLEVEERKMADPEAIMQNRRMLSYYSEKVMNDTISNMDGFSAPAKALLHEVRQVAERCFPGLSGVVIGGFIFLRFLCAALVTPKAYDILPADQDIDRRAQRSLVLISKVIQNLSNQVEFGDKESYLVFLNDFLRKSFGKAVQLVDLVSAHADEVQLRADINVSAADRARVVDQLGYYLRRHDGKAKAHLSEHGLGALWVELDVLLPSRGELQKYDLQAQLLETSPGELSPSLAAGRGGSLRKGRVPHAAPIGVKGKLGKAGSGAAEKLPLKERLERESAARTKAETEAEFLREQIQKLMMMLQQEKQARHTLELELRALRGEAPPEDPSPRVVPAAAAAAAAPSSEKTLPVPPTRPRRNTVAMGASPRARDVLPAAAELKPLPPPPDAAAAVATAAAAAASEAEGKGPEKPAAEPAAEAPRAPPAIEKKRSGENVSAARRAQIIIEERDAKVEVDVAEEERANPTMGLRPVLKRTTSQRRQEDEVIKVQLRKTERAKAKAAAAETAAAAAASSSTSASAPIPASSASSAPSAPAASPTVAAAVAPAGSSKAEKKRFGTIGRKAFHERLSIFQSRDAVGEEPAKKGTKEDREKVSRPFNFQKTAGYDAENALSPQQQISVAQTVFGGADEEQKKKPLPPPPMREWERPTEAHRPIPQPPSKSLPPPPPGGAAEGSAPESKALESKALESEEKNAADEEKKDSVAELRASLAPAELPELPPEAAHRAEDAGEAPEDAGEESVSPRKKKKEKERDAEDGKEKKEKKKSRKKEKKEESAADLSGSRKLKKKKKKE